MLKAIGIAVLILISASVTAQTLKGTRSYEVGEPLTQPAPPLPPFLTILANDSGGTCHLKRDIHITSDRDVGNAIERLVVDFQKSCSIVGARISIEQAQ